MFIWYFIEIAKTSRDSDRSYDLRHSSVVERPASVSFLHSMRRGRFILYIYIYKCGSMIRKHVSLSP